MDRDLPAFKPKLGMKSVPLKKAHSDDTDHSKAHESAEEKFHRARRNLKTYAAMTNVSRKAEKALSPVAVQEMQRLHQEFLISHGKAKELETSEASLLKAWNDGTAFQVLSEMPPRPPETPLCTRGMRSYPSRNDGDKVLGQFKIAALNTKGRKEKNDKTVGQDNVSVTCFQQPGRDDVFWNCFCCLDGHGGDGQWVSYRGCRTIPYYLSKGAFCGQLLQQEQIEAALLNSFECCEKDLVSAAVTQRVQLVSCGSTAVVFLQKEGARDVWVAWTGDSRAIVFNKNGDVLRETLDHKPSVAAEQKRVEKCGCEVIRTEYDDGVVEERINIKGQDYPGICVTRSLGDLVVKNYGVHAIPQVERWDLPEEGWMFCASDGIYEFMESAEVALQVSEALADGQTERQALLGLLKTARGLWEANEGLYCDDITALLVPINRSKLQLSLALGKPATPMTQPPGGVAQPGVANQLPGVAKDEDKCFGGCKEKCAIL